MSRPLTSTELAARLNALRDRIQRGERRIGHRGDHLGYLAHGELGPCMEITEFPAGAAKNVLAILRDLRRHAIYQVTGSYTGGRFACGNRLCVSVAHVMASDVPAWVAELHADLRRWRDDLDAYTNHHSSTDVYSEI